MLKGLKSLKVSSSLADHAYFPGWHNHLSFNLWFPTLVCLASAQLKNNPYVMTPVRAVNITRKEKDYRGMLEYRDDDESRLLKNIVTGMFDTPVIFWTFTQSTFCSFLVVKRMCCFCNYLWNGVIHSDLKPRGVAVSFTPGLPAYIIFMCLRYADSVNSDQRVSSLLNSTISTIKGVIKVEFIHLICGIKKWFMLH